MAEVDTSSYPKPPALPAEKSLLDQVGQYQQLESQKVGIDQQKLNLINQHSELMTNDLASFANDPQATKEEVLKRMHARADAFGMPPQVRKMMDDEFKDIPSGVPLAQNPALSRKLDFVIKRSMDTNQKLNAQYGTPGAVNDQQAIIPTRTSSMRGGPVQSGQRIQIQNPPNTEAVDNDPKSPTYGQRQLLGAQNPSLPAESPTSTAAPPPAQATPLPVARPEALPVGPVGSPAIKGPSANFGGTVLGASVEPPTFGDRFAAAVPKPNGPATGMPPMFEEGKKQLVEDQNLATQKLTGIKNAQKALALLPGVDSGPGTGPYQQALAFLKAQGVLATDPKDKTVVYQEINKYLNRYVQQSGLSQRSDAAQALAENSNPNLMTQLNPALINLTRNAIALDKVEAARPNAFGSKDYSKYGEHRSSFPQSQDERAYGMSDLPKPEAQKLYKEMLDKAKAGDPEGIKFIKSLSIANKQGL